MRTRLLEMADKNEYVSTPTRSKECLETNKAMMSKAHEEWGDFTSLEHLSSTFLLLRITDEPTTIECENKSGPLTYKAALQSPQARQWKEAMR